MLTSNWLRLHLIIVVVLLGSCDIGKKGKEMQSKGVIIMMDVRFRNLTYENKCNS